MTCQQHEIYSRYYRELDTSSGDGSEVGAAAVGEGELVVEGH
jgi:hypothetical protein